MSQMHGLRGRPSASIEEEWLLLLITVQDGVHVSRLRDRSQRLYKSTEPLYNVTVMSDLCEKKIPLRKK